MRPLVLAAVLALVVAHPAHAETKLTLGRTSQALSGTVPGNQSLYVEVVYDSDVPLLIQAQGFRGGERADAGQLMNAMVEQPAGKGRALTWIAFRGAAAIDEIRITAHDTRWQPVASLTIPAPLRWPATPASVRSPRPVWVDVLAAADQRRMDEWQATAADGGADPGGLAIGALVMLAVPAWLVLQIVTPAVTRGGWRVAALLPLVPMGLLIAHALYALSAASNLWPLMVILAAPFACLYLIALLIARAFTRPALV